MPKGYEIKSSHSVEDVFAAIRAKKKKFGCANIKSQRIMNFFKNGTKCKFCGKRGTIFRIERSRRDGGKIRRDDNGWHLNLYALNSGKITMITRDHIIPRSRGGNNSLKNSQPLCSPCNISKSDHLPEELKAIRRVRKLDRNSLITRFLVKFATRRKKGKIQIINLKHLFTYKWLTRAIKWMFKNKKAVTLPRRWVRDRK